MAAKSVGRIAVRVVPDTTKLREDLKKVFTRIERTMQIAVNVDADTTAARRAVDRLVRDLDGQKATLNADLDAGAARVRMAALTRPRTVSLLPEVSKAAAAKALTALAALSGGRVLQDRLRGIGEALGNLDRNLPRFSAVALAVANLGSVLLASTAGLAGVAAGLVSIAGAGIAIPGILGGIAVGAGVMIAALKDASTELATLTPRFEALQNLISEEFWARARQPILDLASNLFPQLQDGARGVAAALGEWTSGLSAGFSASLGDGRLLQMFTDLTASIDASRGGTEAFASIIATLGVTGSQYLPSMASAIADMTVRLDEFLSAAEQDGRLQGWIDSGIAAGSQLVGILGSVGQILGSVAQAATAAGTGGLASLNDALSVAAEIMQGPAFQGALTTLFSGAGQAVSALATALGPIGDLLVTLAPSLSTIMVTAGEAVGGLLSTIATALAQPAFSSGLVALFDGIGAAIEGLGPAIGPVAAALGQFGAFAGELAAQLGPLIGQTLALLAPILGEVFATLQPLLPVLSGVLLQAIQTVAPWIETIVSTLLPPLVDVIMVLAEALGPLLAALEPLTPVFTMIAENLASWVTLVAEFVANGVQQLITLLPPIVDAIVAWSEAMGPLIPAFADLLLQLVPLGNVFLPLIAAILPDLVGLFKEILTAVEPNIGAMVDLMGALGDVATELAPIVADLMPVLIELVRLVLSPLMSFVSGLTAHLTPALQRSAEGAKIVTDRVREFADKARAMRDDIAEVGDKVASTFSDLRGKVEGALSSAGTWLVNSGRALIEGFVDGITGAIGKARAAVAGAVASVREFFPNSPAKRAPFSGRGWVLHSGRAVSEAFATGIREKAHLGVAASQSMMAAASRATSGQTLQSADAYRSSTTGVGGAAGDQVIVNMSGTFNGYDADELARAAARRARDAQAVSRLRSIAKGTS